MAVAIKDKMNLPKTNWIHLLMLSLSDFGYFYLINIIIKEPIVDN